MERLKKESAGMTQKNIERIAALFPNCITESIDEAHSTPGHPVYKKAIHFEKLRQMLSDEVLEGEEAYEFTWVGKKAAIVEANRPTRKTLRPCPQESLAWDTTENLYLEGDNLEVLKLLQESYLGRVKMIYIDPPYNTGSDRFVYTDDYGMSQEEYDRESGRADEAGCAMFRENNRTNARYHSKWCSMIYGRLLLARNLLSDSGAAFIHIDEHEVYTLEMICQEIFGAQNELGTIIWDKRNPKGVVAGVAYQHESILVFCKNITAFAGTAFTKKKEHAEAMLAKAEALVKKHGGVTSRVQEEFKDYINQNRLELSGGESAYRWIDEAGNVYQAVSMAAPDKPETRSHRPLIHPKTGKPCPVPAKGWRFTDSTMDGLLANGRIAFGADETTQPRQKYFLKDNLYEAVSSLLYYGGSGDAMGLPFENPKPVYVARKLIGSLARENGDIVMDFFSGSATTAQAVLELNAEDGVKRSFILVQYPEVIRETSPAYRAGFRTIPEIGKKRICLACDKLREEKGLEAAGLDLGFRVFKVDESNWNPVYYAAGEYHQDMLPLLESNIKEDRSGLDLLFGCLLEWGLPLSKRYASEELAGCTIHTYGDGELIACFDEKIPEPVIKAIAGRRPSRAVFRDSSFDGSPAKINAGELFKMLAPDTRVKVI